MTVLLDQGLYRHLRFQKPGTGVYAFDIVTWPGYLAISGDMGSAVFTRLPDMFEFFGIEKGAVNVDYWTEKLVANDRNGGSTRFSRDLLRALCKRLHDEYVADAEPGYVQSDGGMLWSDIEEEVVDPSESTDDALRRMREFTPTPGSTFEGFEFTDVGEYADRIEGWDVHHLWRLHAIAHAVATYTAYKADRAHKATLCRICGVAPRAAGHDNCGGPDCLPF
jgi:hypothetical protein